LISTLVQIFVAAGICLDVLGGVRLALKGDFFNRFEAATKCLLLGTSLILFGVFLNFGFSAAGLKALALIAFLFLAVPVSAHALAKATYKK
jgi:multicomponent Na+:H+ antiporter subunit G